MCAERERMIVIEVNINNSVHGVVARRDHGA